MPVLVYRAIKGVREWNDVAVESKTASKLSRASSIQHCHTLNIKILGFTARTGPIGTISKSTTQAC